MSAYTDFFCVLDAVEEELDSVVAKWPPYNSAHEASDLLSGRLALRGSHSASQGFRRVDDIVSILATDGSKKSGRVLDAYLDGYGVRSYCVETLPGVIEIHPESSLEARGADAGSPDVEPKA